MKRCLLIAALVFGGLAPAATAVAQQPAAAARQVPLSRIIAEIGRRTPGRQLNTTLGEAGGRPVYFVQWQLANGRVVVFVIDRESGQQVGQQGG